MPDTSSHLCECRSSVAQRPQPPSTDNPSISATRWSDSSLQLFKAQSLLLPLPRGLQPLLLEHFAVPSTTTPSLKDGALSISLTLHVETSASADSVDGEKSSQPHSVSSLVDWTAVVAQLHFITQHYPASNLVTLANVIATYLCHSNQITTITPAAPSPVRQLTLHLSLLPPPLLPFTAASTSPAPPLSHSVTLTERDVSPPTKETNGWGTVDVLIETSAPSAGLYLLHVAPHRSIPSHVHRVMCEAEMILTDGLKCQETKARWGAVHAWGEAVHGYTNDSDVSAAVLCIDTPAFIPTDEIVVTGQHMAAVEVQQAGQAVWRQLARSLLEDQRSGPMPSFTFPGCYSGQSCRLSFDRAAFQPADAVLLLVLSPSSTSSEPCLLFVRHRVRGFELPGGKVECGETELQAAIRELREESGLAVSERMVQPIAQYTLVEEGKATVPHTKTVLYATLDEVPAAGAEHQWLETDKVEWRELPSWLAVRDDSGCSILLRDNVYSICCRVVDELWRQTRSKQ